MVSIKRRSLDIRGIMMITAWSVRTDAFRQPMVSVVFACGATRMPYRTVDILNVLDMEGCGIKAGSRREE